MRHSLYKIIISTVTHHIKYIAVTALFLKQCFQVLFYSITGIEPEKLPGGQFLRVRDVISWLNSSGGVMIPPRIPGGERYKVISVAVGTISESFSLGMGLVKLLYGQFFWVRGVLSYFHSLGEIMIKPRVLSFDRSGVGYLLICKQRVIMVIRMGLEKLGCGGFLWVRGVVSGFHSLGEAVMSVRILSCERFGVVQFAIIAHTGIQKMGNARVKVSGGRFFRVRGVVSGFYSLGEASVLVPFPSSRRYWVGPSAMIMTAIQGVIMVMGMDLEKQVVWWFFWIWGVVLWFHSLGGGMMLAPVLSCEGYMVVRLVIRVIVAIVRMGNSMRELSGWQFLWVRGVMSWVYFSGKVVLSVQFPSGKRWGVFHLGLLSKVDIVELGVGLVKLSVVQFVGMYGVRFCFHSLGGGRMACLTLGDGVLVVLGSMINLLQITRSVWFLDWRLYYQSGRSCPDKIWSQLWKGWCLWQHSVLTIS